jgi:hypothetical protein
MGFPGNTQIDKRQNRYQLLSKLFQVIDFKTVNVRYYVYRLNVEGQQTEVMDGGDGEEDELSAASHWILPSADFHGLWENLIYECTIKENVSL